MKKEFYNNKEARKSNEMLEFYVGGDTTTATKELADPGLVEFYNRLNHREWMLAAEISSFEVNELIHWIRVWNREDYENKIDIDKRKPITILLDTVGGDTMQGLTLHSVMKTSATPIRVVVMGLCASIGIPIMLGATKGMRYAFENTTFLIHDGYCVVSDSSSKSQDTMEHNKRLDERYMKSIVQNSNIAPHQYELKRRVEWYMFADEAYELGLIDRIVENINETAVMADE